MPAKRLAFGLGILALTAMLFAQDQPLPKPQIESAEGQLAPDFTLQNQSGKEFHLSGLRGKPILLIFYRGYW